MIMKPCYILVILYFGFSYARNPDLKHAAPLTESMGQEVIEIAAPVKALPADMDEEPSAEVDEDATTIPPATKKSERKTVEKSRESNKIDDEDARIEKELSEIYKDNADYKNDMDTSTKTSKTTPKTTTQTITETTQTFELVSKDIQRSKKKEEFQFQPKELSKEGIESFRTSIDDISCDKVPLVATKMIDITTPRTGRGDNNNVFSGFIYFIALIMSFNIFHNF